MKVRLLGYVLIISTLARGDTEKRLNMFACVSVCEAQPHLQHSGKIIRATSEKHEPLNVCWFSQRVENLMMERLKSIWSAWRNCKRFRVEPFLLNVSRTLEFFVRRNIWEAAEMSHFSSLLRSVLCNNDVHFLVRKCFHKCFWLYVWGLVRWNVRQAETRRRHLQKCTQSNDGPSESDRRSQREWPCARQTPSFTRAGVKYCDRTPVTPTPAPAFWWHC